MNKRSIVSGIYILDFNSHIKIGRSKNIFTRVRQYDGYREEDSVKKLLFVFTEQHHFLETQSHIFAQQYLPRKARFEKFICPTAQDKMDFISKYKNFLNTHHASIVDEIVDQFEQDKPVEVIEPMPLSNIQPISLRETSFTHSYLKDNLKEAREDFNPRSKTENVATYTMTIYEPGKKEVVLAQNVVKNQGDVKIKPFQEFNEEPLQTSKDEVQQSQYFFSQFAFKPAEKRLRLFN